MRSILRLYLNTSKGNDPFLYNELQRMNIKAKYDEHFHAFYFDAPLPTLFQVAHKSLIAENLYLQLGKPFPATSEKVFAQKLQRMQFKNYLPLRRGLIENMTLNILVRETQYPISDNVMSSLIRNALQKEIVKKQYHQEILQGQSKREMLPEYYQMREIVERKWEQEAIIQQQKQLLLESENARARLLLENSTTEIQRREATSMSEHKDIVSELQQMLPFQPHLTLYIKRNKARLLLKVNEQEMYKLGWKKKVGWAPIRESIATAVIAQSGILDSETEKIIWDPFCGSGTLGIVAAAMHYGAWVRMDTKNFNWKHWAIFKPEYLKEYFQMEKSQKKDIIGKLKLIFSDISFQAANYTLGNLKELAKNLPDLEQTSEISKQPQEGLVKRIRPTENWGQVMNGDWVVGCGDFSKLTENILTSNKTINIVTNLPYLKSRSADHMPLSQLTSVYRRFSQMLKTHQDRIQNVYILIDNANISHPSHFLSQSTQKWSLIHEFQSGGLAVGLYAWANNQIKAEHQDFETAISALKKDAQALEYVPEEELNTALSEYRQKASQIQKRSYYLPRHLIRVKRGWRRVVEKRRKRHMLKAYEMFSRRRDTTIAFAEYAKKKLEVKMLRRGSIWRKRNMRLLNGLPIEHLEKELKKQFEGKIQEALKESQAKQQYRKLKAKEANQSRPKKQVYTKSQPKAGKQQKRKQRR